MRPVRNWTALYLTGVVVGVLLLSRPVFFAFGPRLLLNLTDSVPKGFYKISRLTTLTRDQLVAFRLPNRVYDLVGKRPWLNSNYMFIKPIGALPGDSLFSDGFTVTVNDLSLFPLKSKDSLGERLPSFKGCITVCSDCFVPLSNYSNSSFDGRYFGSIPIRSITGKAIPLLTW